MLQNLNLYINTTKFNRKPPTSKTPQNVFPIITSLGNGRELGTRLQKQQWLSFYSEKPLEINSNICKVQSHVTRNTSRMIVGLCEYRAYALIARQFARCRWCLRQVAIFEDVDSLLGCKDTATKSQVFQTTTAISCFGS